MIKKIEELTPEQKELVPVLVEKWKQHLMRLGPVDREAVEKAVARYYEVSKQPPPLHYIWEPNPKAGVWKAAVLCGKPIEDCKDADEAQKVFKQHWEESVNVKTYFVFVWCLVYTELGLIPSSDILQSMSELMLTYGAGIWWPLDEAAVLTELPIRIDDEGVHYADGWVAHRREGAALEAISKEELLEAFLGAAKDGPPTLDFKKEK